MSDNTPRPRRGVVESADFDIKFATDPDIPTLPGSYRSSRLQSDDSISDYKSLTSERFSWHKSTQSVSTQPEEFHDCTQQLTPPNHLREGSSKTSINRNSANIKLSDHDGCQESQPRTANRIISDVETTSNGNLPRNQDRDDDDDLLQIGNRHRRVSFMETAGRKPEAQHSEISIFGKKQGNSFFHLEFSWKTVLKVFLSIVLYFFDVYSDVNLAVEYMSKGLVLYCWLTAGVVISQLVISAIYDISQFRVMDRNAKKYGIIDKAPVWLWVLRIFGLLFGIVPVYRTILFAIYAYKAKYSQVKHERTRFSLLLFAEKMSTFALFIKESYFESVPQMILQLYILFRQQQRHEVEYAGPSQIFSVATSLLSFAWSLRDYDSNCAALFFNIDFTFFSHFLVFLWRLLTTFSQAAVIALCFSVFPLPFLFVCLADYGLMVAYSCVAANTPRALRDLGVNRCWTACYARVQRCRYVFFVNVFSALPLLISFVFFSEMSRDTQLVCYYGYRLAYTSVLAGVWAGLSRQPMAYRYGFFGAVIVALVAGVLVLGLYYVLYHKPVPQRASKFKCVITSEDVQQDQLANAVEFIKTVSLKNMTFSYRHLE